MSLSATRLYLPLLLATTAVAQTTSGPIAEPFPPAAYAGLTNPLGSATNFNIETVRGLLLTGDGLFAINTHASTIVFHSDLVAAPEQEWPTVHNPVAITNWNGRLLVVGGSSWSLAEHHATNGRILRHVELPAEPADIVVDDAHDTAYIACQGANVVVKIDLVTFTEAARYDIPSQRPRFLSFDESGAAPVVYVAPSLSGNNTTLDQRITQGGDIDSTRSKVVDLDAIAGSDLPDEDLFEIDLSAPPGTAVTAVLHGAGTLLAEHGRNPFTGDYWMLSTESHNAVHNSEDKHRGVFANAQLAIASSLGGPGRPTPSSIIDLDVPMGGGAKSVNTSMSGPFAMAFHSAGLCAIASSTSDLITVVNRFGVRIADLPITQVTHPSQPQMPPQIGRAIPRDLIWDENSATLTVYCWGWNKVLVYNVNQTSTPPFWLDLGPDPQPVAVQQGRSIFYDAKRPVANDATGNPFPGAVTCATCHPAGGMDLLAWGLSDSVKDIKDLMVTQSLLSIGDTFPYHWRGERNLDHFNGAFKGLLGFAAPLDETPGGELDQFEAFIFSLQAPANPNQDVSRTLTGIDARFGQDVFLNKPDVLFGQFSCADCHTMPSGTNGENIAEVFINIPGTSILDVTHLRQLHHKDQEPVTVSVPLGDGSGFVNRVRAKGGFGITHNGSNFDLQDFIKSEANNGPFGITIPESQQITAFVRQFDQGIAPAAHRAYLANANSLSAVAPTIRKILLRQAVKGWVSVAAVGFEDISGVTQDLRWVFNPTTSMFTCSDPGVPARNWTGMLNAITAGGQYLFVGLPPANAFRYALDPDNDNLTDAQEAALPVATNARSRDTDADGYEDGYEVQVASSPVIANVPMDSTPPTLRPGSSLVLDHNGATFAKYFASFTEPVTWSLEALDMNQAPPTVVSVTRSTAFAREAMIHMHELMSSTPTGDVRNYAPRLTITDPRGNQTTITGATFAAGEQFLVSPNFVALIGDLSHAQPPLRTGSSMALNVDVNVRFKGELNGPIPMDQRVVAAHVLKRSAGSDTWTISSGADLSGAQVVPGFDVELTTQTGSTVSPFTALPGDFLLSTQTDPNGNANFSVTHHNLSPGDEVRIAIVGVLDPAAGFPTPTFDLISLFEWDLPRTPSGPSPTVPTAKDLRGVTVAF